MRGSFVVILAACSHPAPAPEAHAPPVLRASSPFSEPTPIALPGAPPDGVSLDYLAYDTVHHQVWVPAGGTGNVDVIDSTTGKLTPVAGFATKEVERRGTKRIVGPSSAAVGDGVVYIGNRGDSSVCAIDATTLVKQGCITLDANPDGLQYVAATHELWVTIPHDKSIRILDVTTPAQPVEKPRITLDAEPEGFAVDNQRGVFFTNLEDADKTIAIDLHSHAVTRTWDAKCGKDGPRGLIFDPSGNHLVVVCTSSLETLDIAHDGSIVGIAQVGDGLDAIDYSPTRHALVAAAGRAQKLAIVSLDDSGALVQLADVPTAKGARNAVVANDGTTYVADGPAGAILAVPWPVH